MSWANYDEITPAILNDGGRFLSGLSSALILHALGLINDRDYWHDSDFLEVSDDKWDEIASAIDAAIDEVMNEDAISSGEAMIVGEIKAVAGDGVPDGCLLCDGTQYLRTSYPDLYVALGANYQVDADSFTVPDLRGRFVMGQSDSHTLSSSGGEEQHTLTIDELPSHNHPGTYLGLEQFGTLNRESRIGTDIARKKIITDNVGGDQPHNNLPPFVVMKYVIVTGA